MTKQGGWPPTGFGARLKALRERAGLTQPALADKAGCNKFTVAKLERGAQEPAWPLVLALAKALGVDCTAFTVQATTDDATPCGTQETVTEPATRPRGMPKKEGSTETKGKRKKGKG